MNTNDLRKKRSRWEWDDYTHTVETYKKRTGLFSKPEIIRVDNWGKNNGSSIGRVRFVNDQYGMAVFGDFGNWVFCRNFHPSSGGYVSDGYWNEKLKIGSTQKHATYDSRATYEELQKLLTGLPEYGLGEDEEDAAEEIRSLMRLTDDELDYTHELYRGRFMDYFDTDAAPLVMRGSVQLEIIFDIFDEMCRRIEAEETATNKRIRSNPFLSAIDLFLEMFKRKELT